METEKSLARATGPFDVDRWFESLLYRRFILLGRVPEACREVRRQFEALGTPVDLFSRGDVGLVFFFQCSVSRSTHRFPGLLRFSAPDHPDFIGVEEPVIVVVFLKHIMAVELRVRYKVCSIDFWPQVFYFGLI